MTDRLWISMHAALGRIEDYATIEQGHDIVFAHRHRCVPKFQSPAELRFPVFIKINEHVDPALQVHELVMIEIGVDGQVPALSNLMDAGTKEIWIGNEALDPRYILDHLYKRLRIKRIEKPPYVVGKTVWLIARLEAFLIAIE